MIVQGLKGTDLGSISVKFPQQTELYLNEDAAQLLGITLPEELKAQASRIIRKAQS